MSKRARLREPNRRSLRGVAFAGCVALALPAGCGGGGTSSSAPTSTATTPTGGLAVRGKALYASKGCSSCHSLNGSAGTGPT